jgi:hypothetical protein
VDSKTKMKTSEYKRVATTAEPTSAGGRRRPPADLAVFE